MTAIILTINMILGMYTWVLFATVILSWLLAFGVINQYNSFISQVMGVLRALTEPVLAPIRKVVPPVGGLDLSIIVVFIGIFFLRTFLMTSVLPALT